MDKDIARSIEDAKMLGHAFGGALTASLNMTGALMHGLVAKGLLTKEQARALIDEAAASSARMTSLPDVFRDGIKQAYAAIRRGFE